MKRILAIALASAALLAGCAGGRSSDKDLKVLMIGNSFSICVIREMPAVAKSMGLGLDLTSLYIGGSSLQEHWNNFVASTNAAFKPYGHERNVGGRTLFMDVPANLVDVLKSEAFDVITIQQASHLSWKGETFTPYADDLIAAIRKLQPNAEIMFQETWSYTPWDGRLAKWGITADEMYARIHKACSAFSSSRKLRMIPTGAAVDLYRKTLPVVYTENSLGGDPCGGRWGGEFVKDEKTGKWKPDKNLDVFHLGYEGEYLQALTWTAMLFGVDVTRCPYVPSYVKTPERAEKMKACAQEAVARQLGRAAHPIPFIRGVKAMLPARDAFGDYRTLVDLMARFGLNTLMLELGGAMEYKSHPEVNEGWIEYARIMNEYPGKTSKIQKSQKWHKNSIHSENGGGGVLTQKEIAELVAYARERGIDVIPEVPCLSHSDYLLWRHKELAERQDDPYPDCYCPSDPRSYALLFDLLDEVVALFKPKIINIGHDEWYSIAICDKCRGKSGAELYAGDIRKIRDHLAAKGVRTMMWSEKLLDFKFCDSKKPWAGAATDEFPATHEAIDMLPKDVILQHWYWSLGRTLEDVYADRGYAWTFGNYSARGMLDYPGRSRKRGFSGYMLSNWGRSDIPTLQRNGVLADIVMDKLVEESPDPDAEIDELWMRMFRELFAVRHPVGKNYFRIRHYATQKREFRCFFDGFYLKKGDWLLGRYVLTLADGKQVTQDVWYGENVSHADVNWNPPREWDTDARDGRGELAAVAYSTIPMRKGDKTWYEIAIEIPENAKVVSCVFEPAAGLAKDAVVFEPLSGAAAK